MTYSENITEEQFIESINHWKKCPCEKCDAIVKSRMQEYEKRFGKKKPVGQQGASESSLRDLGEWTPKGEAKVRSANIDEIAETDRNDQSPRCGVTI